MAIKRLPSTGDAPRTTGVPESLVSGGSSDSAGFPWAGRTFDHHETAFADDDGATGELGPPSHLDRRDELVEVDVEHPATHRVTPSPGAAHRTMLTSRAGPPRCRRRPGGR